MKTTLQFILALFFTLQISAQEKTIYGTITDENNLPLPGVNIVKKGTYEGIVTDFDGNYTITASIGEVLVFSSIGYKTEERAVQAANMISFSMQADTASLDEVIITGHSSSPRRTFSPSKAQIKRKKQKSYHKSITNQLQGKVAGVNVSSGNTASIKIRGINSISNKQPLYIVDGVPINNNYNSVIKSLDPKAIESIKVHKSLKAKRLFGQSAKNGCIVITTKKGNYRVENNEAYAQIHENQFERTNTAPLSTFSIDVDKASYSNVRRLINNGATIPSDAIKIEEMVNYFDYDYPQPEGEHPFSINTEVVKTPWNSQTKLVKIGLQGKTYDNSELPASNLTFLIDVSGSMGGNLELLKSAFKLLVNQLREKDRVSIVVYAGAAGVVLKPTSGKNKDKILKALDQLRAGGSTAGGQGIELAYKLAQEHYKKNGNNRVILATDGDFNVGASSDKAMEKLIEEKRKSGVFLSVLGFGYGNYKDSKLEILADKGNGNHAYIDTMQEAKLIFGKEFGGTLFTIAKDVKIQVEFNPTKVQAYRLIGYENRLLAAEDFIDDTKDAGELGSGHTVTALYEVIPTGVESDYLKKINDLKYTKSTTEIANSDELFTVKFRYKKPDGEKSIEMVQITKDNITEPSLDMNFAASVALFGMQLKHSKFHNNSKKKDAVTLAQLGRGEDKNGYRAEFLRLVETVIQ